MTDENRNYTKTYVLNNQPTDLENIPEDASYQCVHQLDEQLLFIEVYKQGGFSAIENFGEEGALDQAALATAYRAVELGAIVDLQSSLAVNIYFQPSDFDLGFDHHEGQVVVIKAQFKLSYNGQEWLAATAYPDAYVAELMEMEPVPRLLKRGIYNSAKQLMFVEFPLLGINRHLGVADEIGVFMEKTPVGEQ